MVDFDENDTFIVQVLEAMSALIISAFSLVAALAWNDAIKTLIGNIFEDEGLGLFIYAVIVTIIAVIMAILITRAVRKAKKAIRTRSGWRHLTARELEILVKNNNMSDNWDHVLVSDPCRGYGIGIRAMLAEAGIAAPEEKAA